MNMHYHAQSSFPPVFNYAQGGALPYPAESSYPGHNGYHGFPYVYGYPQPRSHIIAEQNALSDPKTDAKPRLSKEEVDRLEKVFQENPKPSSSIKAQLADTLGLERPRINNWFQNRRAKAKQERKQEEYEAQRVAARADSESVSPGADTPSGASENAGESVRRRVQPSSAIFPDLSSTSQTVDASGDNENLDDDSVESDGSDSPRVPDHSGPPQDDGSGDFQSPLSIDFSNSETASFAQPNYSHSGPAGNFASFMSHQQVELTTGDEQSTSLISDLPSPNERYPMGGHCSRRYSSMMDTDFSSSATTPFLQSQAIFGTHRLDGSSMESISAHSESASTPINERQETALVRQGIPTPTDSFKSPPPPANIASRRNIPRPAALQTTSLRSRSYNLNGYGPKTALDGSKRVDPSSPGSAMRRIASTAGSIHGRIQKSTSGPRSPMFFSRNPEAILQQYHTRSPVGPVTSTFPGAAPPTPMTPAIVDQQGVREPTVSSTCSDDGSFLLGGALPPSLMQELKAESNLKTPPSTPGLLPHFGNHNYNANPFGTGVDFHADQPLLTPYFQNEFVDFRIHTIPPSYAEMDNGSLPTTPLYPGMMGSIQDQNAFGHNTMGNTQFDWDANESVNSSKSSPNQPRSKQIQFTQNMTPQDYTGHQEK
ncbi:hypothetical protein F4677DRAFT_454121 [Hypoxylon crocopeplum]|nr:hypothetical protein F4677DRAFT_454121 [Hypoxylon crocopeplum]